MKKEEWKDIIIEACKNAKTYKPFFDSVIDTLAQIMELRDDAHRQYIENGAEPTIIMYTDRSSRANVHKNPMLVMENELNAQALSYWRELGLTPNGLKKLNVNIVNDENSGSFEQLLSSIASG